MNGLLDFDDPKTIGLLSMGLGLLGSRGRFGEALGQAGLQGINAMQQATDRRTKKQVQDFQLRQMTREEAAAKKKEADEQAMLEAARASFVPGFAGTPGTQMVNDALPPDLQIGAQAPIPARPSAFDKRAFIDRMRMINPLEAIKLEQSFKKETPFNKVDPKDYTTESVTKFAQTGNYGDLIPVRKMEVAEGQVYDPYAAKPGTRMSRPQLVDTGAGFKFVTPEPGMEITKSMSPAERDAAARGWAANRIANENLGLARQRFDFEKTKPADDKTTEGERKAATLLRRMEGSLQQLNTALGENPRAASPEYLSSTIRSLPIVGGSSGANATANLATSQERQRVEAAQLDILDAALTLGTGAAYTREQLEGYRKSYFPQMFDSPKTIADKQARLRNVLEAARLAAGRATGGANAPADATPNNDPLGLR